MTTTITAFFTENGVPRDGLLPEMTIRETISGTVVISAQVLSPTGSGFYYATFEYDSDIDYSVIVDGGSELLDTERYVYTSVTGSTNIIPGRLV